MNMRLKVILSWAAVFLWMLLIFRLSSQVAAESNGLSLGMTNWIHKLIERLAQFDISYINHIVRKAAHFSAYLILSVLVSKALGLSGVSGVRRLILILAICVLYAISDELHQLFVSGRSGQPADVIIDSFGAVTGIGSIKLFKLVRRNNRV